VVSLEKLDHFPHTRHPGAFGFVLEPLAELAPGLRHPANGKTVEGNAGGLAEPKPRSALSPHPPSGVPMAGHMNQSKGKRLFL